MRLVDRFWVLLTVPVVLCLALYGAYGARAHRAELRAEVAREIDDTATLLAITFSTLPPAIERNELHRLANELTRQSRVLGVGLYDPDGRWIGGSDVATRAHAHLEDTARLAIRSRRAVSLGVRVEGVPCLARVEVLSAPDEGPVGAVAVLRDLGHVDAAVRTWAQELAVVALVLVGAMALLGYVVAGRLASTVERFTTAVERVREGELEATVPIEGPTEWRAFGETLNTLITSLRAARVRLATEESARSALEAELHRAQMLAVAGQVAATLGHEIGSPLNVILGRARLAAERDELSPELRKTFTSIASQCERITRVVSQFLTLARPPTSGAGATTDAIAVAREVVSFLGHECRRVRIKSRVDAPDAKLTVAAGHDRLFQVLFNLAMNAVQAQPDGGALVVEVRDAAERIEIDVRDAGRGVPESIRGKVFDPFFSTRLSEGGTGLGLAVVAGIVRDLGGTVNVDQGHDEETPGAVFTVRLPRG
ncbi:MAG: histidine kinase [Myxococcales bacterium]|nr:histidine kinase [Myxococcales bacterium]